MCRDPVHRPEPWQAVCAEAKQPRDVAEDKLNLEQDFRGHFSSYGQVFRPRVAGFRGIGLGSAAAAGCTTSSRDRPFAIMSTGHEAELHSQAGRTGRRGGVPGRCPTPQLSQSGGGARGNAIGDQPGSPRARGARRRSALHPHDAQCRPERSRRTISRARKAGFRGTRRRKRGRTRPWAAACRAVAPHGAAVGGADPAGADDRILLPGLSRGRGGDRCQRGTGRPRGRRV